MSGILVAFSAAKTAIATAVDEYFNRTTLLLSGNGTNGAQNNTFLDSSTNNFSITRNGNTTQGTFSPFSQTGWSNYFDGSGDYLTIADSSTLEPGSSNFTIECWIYPTANGSFLGVFSKRTNNSTDYSPVQVLINSGTMNLFASTSGSSWAVNQTASSSPPLNTWSHIAVVRNGTGSNNLVLYLNGVSVATGSVSNTALANNAGAWAIAADSDDGGGNFAGYVSNFRYVLGSAVYTGAFTPPTTALTAVTNTVLLTCQSNRFIDNSSNAFAITRNGDVSVQAFSPFAPTAAYSAATVGGSGYFDGNGDYLSIANTANLQFGSGDFTLEFFVYFNALSGNQTIYDKGYTGTNAFVIQTNTNTGTMIVYANGTAIITASSASPVGQWDHYAVVRSGTTITLYRNGVSVGSATNSVNFNNAAVTNIGAGLNQTNSTYTAFANAYISNVRLVKGSAVYTAPFTPPTAPHTAITNTQLLLNFTNGGIVDATGKNVLETVGNAQISTSISKWGGASIALDGTGDYLVSPSGQNYSLPGDFTIEGWAYLSASGNYRFFTVGDTVGTSGIEIYVSGGNWVVYSNAATRITGSSATRQTWIHVALVRSGSTVTLYINGTASGSTWTSSATFSGACYVGAEFYNGSVTSDTNGNIDDFRISKFARYTTTFTAPTAAFPTQ